MTADSFGRTRPLDESRQVRATGRWLAVQERANELLRTYPSWRRGQALFNALHGMDPVLADQIRGTVADPFHNDSRVQAFARAVMDGCA